MRLWLGKHFALLAGLALLAAALAWFAPWALDQLRQRDRYRVPFAAVDCPPPPTLSRADFLDEVQYLSGLPDDLPLLDAELPARLAAAFAAHPWVHSVDRVEVTPPRRVRVHLRYRIPVLAVPHGQTLRAVDADGVLLPRDAPTAGLPRYVGKASAPTGPAGTRWGDAAVEAAARQAAKGR